jgi:antitoxin component YwqK of YwqJK toxin-antitoxin module
MMRVMLNEADFNDDDRLTYGGQLFTGVAVEVGSDGVLLAESTYRDGVHDGPGRAFRDDGSVRAEDNYHFGILVESREWHRNGQLAYEVHNDEFGRMLSEQRWNEDGSPQS